MHLHRGSGMCREINSIRFTGPVISIPYPSGTVKQNERTPEKKTKIQKAACIRTDFMDFVEISRFLEILLNFREKYAIIPMIEISVPPFLYCFSEARKDGRTERKYVI